MRRAVALAFLALMLAGAGLSGQQAGTPTATHTVRIDALVSDSRGRPIDDLKAGDFELREGGVVQTIESLQIVKPGGSPSGPAASGRLFGIYIDEYHLSAGESAVRARDAVTAFINQELRPDDRIVVMK